MVNLLKRLGSLALALIMVVSLLPVSAMSVYAATEETTPATESGNEVATVGNEVPEGWIAVATFADLQTAIESGGNIMLTAGFPTTAKLELKKNVTIDFNGFTVDLWNGTSYPFEIKAHVVLQDTFNGGGGLTLDGGSRSHQMIRVNSGSLTVKSGHYQLNATYTSIAHTIYGWRPITIEGGTIKVTSSSTGEIRALTIANSGKDTYTGSLTVTGGNFEAIRGEGVDGTTYGIVTQYSNVSLSGCTVKAEDADATSTNVMAVRVEGVAPTTTYTPTLTISSGEYTATKKSGDAYALYVAGTGEVDTTVTGGTFKNNTGPVVGSYTDSEYTKEPVISGGSFLRTNGNKYTLDTKYIPAGYYQHTDGTVFSDATHPHNDKLGGKAPTCSETGIKDHYQCQYCNAIFYKEGETVVAIDDLETWKTGDGVIAIDDNAHNVVKTDAKAAACTEAGNPEYWTCKNGCGKYFADEACTEQLEEKDLVIPMLGHSFSGAGSECANGCGMIACSEGHTPGEHVTAQAPTCDEAGNNEYYICSVCNATVDAQGNDLDYQTDILLPAAHTAIAFVAQQDATFEADGFEAYWYCSDCEKYYAGTETEVGDIIDAPVVIPAKIAIAKIGEEKYETLQAAVDAAGEDATITVAQDFTLAETVTVASGKKITVDFTGKTITASVTVFENSGNLTLVGGTDGQITSSASDAVVNKEGATMTVESGIYETTRKNTTNGGVITVFRNNGSLTITNGTVTATATAESTKAGYVYGVFNAAGEATIHNGTVKSYFKSTAAVNGHGLAVGANGGKLTIKNGDFCGYSAATGNNSLGGSYFYGTAEVHIEGGTFNAQKFTDDAMGQYYGVRPAGSARVYISGGTIDGKSGAFNTNGTSQLEISGTAQINGRTWMNSGSWMYVKGGTFNADDSRLFEGEVINGDKTVEITVENARLVITDGTFNLGYGSNKVAVLARDGTSSSSSSAGYYRPIPDLSVLYPNAAATITNGNTLVIASTVNKMAAGVNAIGKDGNAKAVLLKDVKDSDVNVFKTSFELDMQGHTWVQTSGTAINGTETGTEKKILRITNGQIICGQTKDASAGIPVRTYQGSMQLENMLIYATDCAPVGYYVVNGSDELNANNWIKNSTLIGNRYYVFSFHNSSVQTNVSMYIENSDLINIYDKSGDVGQRIFYENKSTSEGVVILGENVNMYSLGTVLSENARPDINGAVHGYTSGVTVDLTNINGFDLQAAAQAGLGGDANGYSFEDGDVVYSYKGTDAHWTTKPVMNMWTSNHTYGDATCANGPTCSCGAVNGEPTGHAYPDTWTDNGENHKKVCANGCGEDIVEAHEYVYASTGVGTCECGATTTCQHNYEYTSHNNATCTDNGTKHGVCTNCGNEVDVLEEGSKLQHSYTGEDNKCVNGCGKTQCENVGAHMYDNAVEWTFDAEKKQHYKDCDICGETGRKTEDCTEDAGTQTLAPTCTAEGETTYKCTVCENVLRTEQIEKKSHEMKFMGGQNADCTQKGIRDFYYCDCMTYFEDADHRAIGDYAALEAWANDPNGGYIAPYHTFTYTPGENKTHTVGCSRGCGYSDVEDCIDENADHNCDKCGAKLMTPVAKVNGTEYETLAEAVAAAGEGETVILLGDASGAGVVINKNVTIDFGTYTYTFTEGVGSTGTTSNGFQILKGNKVTLKNGTLKVAEESKTLFYTIIQNYADLTVTDMTLDGTNLDKWSTTDGDSYVLSVNCGNVTVDGNTNIIANDEGDLAFAFDSCDKTASGYTVPTVTVKTTGKIAGKIETSGDAKIAISSGTYTVELADAWCAEGFIPADNGDGTYGVKEGSYVAQVGQNKYETLAEAVAAASEGDVITVIEDHEITAPVVIEKNVTIDLNGKTLTGVDVYPVIRVQGGASVTVKNGTIVNATDYVFVLGAADKSTAGNLTIESGSYTGLTTVASVTKGTLTISGGRFETAAGEYGSTYLLNCYDANYANGTAKIVVTGGEFVGFNPEDNKAESGGADFTADGYVAGKIGDNWVVGEMPEAEIIDLGVTTLRPDEYRIFDGSSLVSATEILNIPVTMQFVAKDTAEEAAKSAFADWNTDFYISLNNTTDGVLDMTGCYLVGNYDPFGWIAIPLTGVEIYGNTVYPVLGTLAPDWFTYEAICASVKDFMCGIYLTPEFLAAYPDVKVNLNLEIAPNTIPVGQSHDDALVADAAEYTAEKLAFAAEVDGVMYKTFAEAVAAANGAEITLLAPVVIEEDTTLENVTVNGNGVYPAFRIQNGATLTMNNCTVVNATDYIFTLGSADVEQAGNLVINSGSYTGATTIVNVVNGTATIAGGNFAMANGGDATYMLNCYDASYKAGIAKIVVKGGTFVGFNPEDNKAESGGADFTAEGYIGVKDGDNYIVREGEWIAQVGQTKYEYLAEAVAAAEAGDTVTLLKDVQIDELIKIEKAITVDLGGNTVTATSKKAFEVYADATICNGTIEAANRCVDTREAVELTLADLTLIADKYTSAYSNPQPLTIGGSENGTVVNMTNVNISAAAGYGIITFVKTDLTATDSVISGYNALYVKPGSEESQFTFVNTDLKGSTAGNDVEGNSFSTIAVRADDVAVVVDADSSVTATGNYCSAISLGGVYPGETTVAGAAVTVAGTISGNILDTVDVTKNTVAVRAEYADELLAAGYITEAAQTEGLVVVTGEAVAAVNGTGYTELQDAIDAAETLGTATITLLTDQDVTYHIIISEGITLDLNGYSIKTTRTFTVYGDVIDGEIGGYGTVSASKVHIMGTKSFLPIYDSTVNAYRFYAYAVDSRGMRANGTDAIKLGVQLDFVNIDAYSVIAATDDTKIDLYANISWTGLPAPTPYRYMDSTIKTYAANVAKDYENKGTTTRAITLTLYGLSQFTAGDVITVTPEVVSETAVSGCGSMMSWTIAGN